MVGSKFQVISRGRIIFHASLCGRIKRPIFLTDFNQKVVALIQANKRTLPKYGEV